MHSNLILSIIALCLSSFAIGVSLAVSMILLVTLFSSKRG